MPVEVNVMSKIHIDPSLEKKLNGLNEIVEFCTEQGQTRGFFVPAEMYRECMSTWLRHRFPIRK